MELIQSPVTGHRPGSDTPGRDRTLQCQLRYYWKMDANQPQAARSSSTRRVLIEDPSPQLIDAVRAQIALPSPDSHGYWEVGAVRSVEVEVQLTRVTHYGSDGTTEQPIVWD